MESSIRSVLAFYSDGRCIRIASRRDFIGNGRGSRGRGTNNSTGGGRETVDGKRLEAVDVVLALLQRFGLILRVWDFLEGQKTKKKEAKIHSFFGVFFSSCFWKHFLQFFVIL